MNIHLVDGTYELFRCYFGAPSYKNKRGKEVGAARALVRSFAAWLRTGEVTHIAAAFDHVVRSFRNDLFDGYKTEDGVDPDLLAQFELAERASAALGIVVWPMVEFEADDALATGAHRFSSKKTKVLICSPDKDLAQCVRADRVVLWDRKKNLALDAVGVVKKFGIPPGSIPDFLALVGDTADGIPGVPRWGEKSAALVLAAYGTIDKIPAKASAWKVVLRGAPALAESLAQERKAALLYKKLATLRFDVPILEKLSDLEWKGADRKLLEAIAVDVADPNLLTRVNRFR